MDQEVIPWALYDLFGTRTLDSPATMQDYSRCFLGKVERVLIRLHMPYKVLGVFSSGIMTRCSKMRGGSPFEKTFAPIIQSAHFAIRYVEALVMRTDSATFTSTRNVACVT